MGKKKFIDKKTANRYVLTSGGLLGLDGTLLNDDGQQGQSNVGPSNRPADDFYDEDPELAEMLGLMSPYDDSAYAVSEERRRELIELGFPDDGYDYLRHLKDPVPPRSTAGPSKKIEVLEPVAELVDDDSDSVLVASSSVAGQPSSSAVGYSGPSVFIPAPKFVPPAEDTKIIDARGLHVADVVQDDASVPESALQAESAFAKTLQPKGRGPSLSLMSGGGNRMRYVKTAEAVSAVDTAKSVGLRGRLVSELAEIEEVMHLLEEADDAGVEEVTLADLEAEQKLLTSTTAGEPGPSNRAAGEPSTSSGATTQKAVVVKAKVQGDTEWADWLDDFVVLASAPDGGEGGVEDDDAEDAASQHSYDPEEDEEDDVGELPGGFPGAAKSRRGAGSIASTYWRPEREDRKDGLQNLDDHFEQLALQYDDDELGNLDDGEKVAVARGAADIGQFSSVLDQFMDEHKAMFRGGDQEDSQVQSAHHGGGDQHDDDDDDDEDMPSDMDEEQYEAWMAQKSKQKAKLAGDVSGLGKQGKVETLEHRDEDVIAATKARIAAAAVAVLDPEAEDEVLPDTYTTMVVDRGERWDCESVLSLRSNISNHPGRIVEPQRRTGGSGGPKIVLSDKTGMPVLPQNGKGGKGGNLQSVIIPEEDNNDSGSDDGTEDSASDAGTSIAIITERKKGETAEEKKARKAAVKEAKRASRASKKELKGMFKAEAQKQKKQAAGGGNNMGNSTYVIS